MSNLLSLFILYANDHKNNSSFWYTKTNELQWRLAFNNYLTRCFCSARIDMI